MLGAPLFVLECCGAAAKGQINPSAKAVRHQRAGWEQSGHSCGFPGTGHKCGFPGMDTSVDSQGLGTNVDSQGLWGCIPTWLHHGRSNPGVQHTALAPISVLKQVLLPRAADFKAPSINPGLVSNKAELCAAGCTNETNSAVTLAEFSARTQE